MPVSKARFIVIYVKQSSFWNRLCLTL